MDGSYRTYVLIITYSSWEVKIWTPPAPSPEGLGSQSGRRGKGWKPPGLAWSAWYDVFAYTLYEI
jgi:hypothetical protein